MNHDEQVGTKAGYETHKRRHETPCDECRQAQNDYVRQWRAANPDKAKAEMVKNLARTSAAWTLTRIHREEFDALVAQELARRDAP